MSSTDARFSFALASRLIWACMVVFMITPFLGCKMIARDINITPNEGEANEEKTEDEPTFFKEVVFERGAESTPEECWGYSRYCAWRN